ncbi:hypothetical protein CCMA1212_001678, partial [Trichoderma ghanense]
GREARQGKARQGKARQGKTLVSVLRQRRSIADGARDREESSIWCRGLPCPSLPVCQPQLMGHQGKGAREKGRSSRCVGASPHALY